MSRYASSRREAIALRATGVVYLLVLAALVWLSIAIYTKTFSDHVTVSVATERAGLQLNVGGDVRMNGAIVGRVSSVKPDGEAGRVDLQIDREAADQIPADVSARIVPTTLFGQKYVELTSDSSPVDAHLVDGSQLVQDTSAEAVEVTELLDRLEPVVTAVSPDRLSATLTALSTGLDGNGQKLGTLVNRSGSYLQEFNADLPLVEKDLRLIERVAGQYADAAPDLLKVAENATVSARTLRDNRRNLESLFTNVSRMADSTRVLLEDVGGNFVDSARIARPTLELLDEFAPQLTCMIDGFLVVRDQSAAQVRGGSIQGDFTLGSQLPGYGEDDQLEFNTLGAGPACHGLPNAQIPFPDYTLDEGYDRPPANDLTQILLGPNVGGGQ